MIRGLKFQAAFSKIWIGTLYMIPIVYRDIDSVPYTIGVFLWDDPDQDQ